MSIFDRKEFIESNEGAFLIYASEMGMDNAIWHEVYDNLSVGLRAVSKIKYPK